MGLRHRIARMAMATLAGLGLGLAVALLLPGAAARASARGADGHFESRRSAHFLLLEDVAIDHQTGPHGSRQFERDVLATLESGYDALDDLLGLRPRRRIEVQVYDAAVFDRDFAGLFRFPAAGFYGGGIRVRGDVRVTPALAATLHHELVHAALDAEAPWLELPAWLNEGLAEWFASRVAGRPPIPAPLRARLAAGGQSGALLPIEALSAQSFAGLDGERAAWAYLQARALVDYLARHEGERGLRALLARLLRTGDLDRSLELASGLDTRGLDAAWRAELGLGP